MKVTRFAFFPDVVNEPTYQVDPAGSDDGSETFTHREQDGSTRFETMTKIPITNTIISLEAVYDP
jgi:hypothetical protein